MKRMNKEQRQRYLDKQERFHSAVTVALERAQRNGLTKPHDIGTSILVCLADFGLDVRDTISPDKRSGYRFGTSGDVDTPRAESYPERS